jgi:hypothetical protein
MSSAAGDYNYSNKAAELEEKLTKEHKEIK